MAKAKRKKGPPLIIDGVPDRPKFIQIVVSPAIETESLSRADILFALDDAGDVWFLIYDNKHKWDVVEFERVDD